jgi:hypothetical protein
MSRGLGWPIIIICLALVSGLAGLSQVTGPGRVVVTFAFLLVCPGMAFIQLLNLKEALVKLTLAVALSLALAAIVAQILILGQVWSAELALFGLIGLSLAGTLLQLIKLYRHNRTAAPARLSKDAFIFVSTFMGLSLVTLFLGFFTELSGQEPVSASLLPTATPTELAGPSPTPRPSPTLTSTPLSPTQTPSPTRPAATAIAPLTSSPTPAATASRTPTSTASLLSPTPTASPTATRTPSATPTEPPAPAPASQPAGRPRPALVVYVQSNFQSHDLNILTPDGVSRPLQAHGAAPAFSPDGNRIAFYGEPGISLLGGAYSQGSGIWLIDRQGENPVLLHSIDQVKNLAWSPDQTKLAFEVAEPNGSAGIRVIDAAGGLEISRFPGGQPAWSPDSRYLAIKACLPECGLWQVNFDGSGATPLTTHGNDSFPTWSGPYLVFASDREGNWEIYRLRLADQTLLALTKRVATDITPAFSADGQEIYIRTDDQGGGTFWRITALSLDGQQERLVREGVGPSDDWGLARPTAY